MPGSVVGAGAGERLMLFASGAGRVNVNSRFITHFPFSPTSVPISKVVGIQS